MREPRSQGVIIIALLWVFVLGGQSGNVGVQPFGLPCLDTASRVMYALTFGKNTSQDCICMKCQHFKSPTSLQGSPTSLQGRLQSWATEYFDANADLTLMLKSRGRRESHACILELKIHNFC